MADSRYKDQRASRGQGHDELQLASWRSSVIGSGIPKYAEKRKLSECIAQRDPGFLALTHGPPDNPLGMFELHVRGKGFTIKYTIEPDATYKKYVLSTEGRSAVKHVFQSMDSLQSFCVVQVRELSNDKRDYEKIRELDTLRAASLSERDICNEMGSLQLKEEEKVSRRLGYRRLPMPPFVDRSTKPGPRPDRLTEAEYSSYGSTHPTGKHIPGVPYDAPPDAHKGSRVDGSRFDNSPPIEAGHYLRNATSGEVKKVEFDGNYGWLSNFR